MYIYDLEKPPPIQPVSEGELFNISNLMLKFPLSTIGETTSNLTSKWKGTFQYFQHEKKHEDIKWEIIVFLKK